MTLAPGTRLGVYEIHSALGAGGMGEVYRARDTRLQRDVALKILPEAFAADAERLARFEREAQMLASLNHPHIAAIHGVEESGDLRALVLELVEGNTLADLIAASPIPFNDALPIARQIAEALEAAHEQGIVHRDLKPANIKVRPDGTVKVLDFGLAKLAAGPPQGGHYGDGRSVRLQPDLSQSPTITTPAMTQLGVILGTAAYMAPEQAKGREADKRSDVWAFGAVLYEMLTGRRAFEGEDISDTLASVLKSDPDWTRLPSDVPVAVRTLMQRCLTKDRRLRVSDISAAKFVLSELPALDVPPASASTTGQARTKPRSRWRWVLPVSVAVLTPVILAAVWALRQPPVQQPLTQFSFTLPEGQGFFSTGRQVLAISPNGTRIVYVANQRLYVRPIGELDPRAIPGTEADGGALNPVFSPDGQSIVYFSAIEANHAVMKRISIAGGAPSVLATLVTLPTGASWGQDGILIGQGSGGIVRVSQNGGAPEQVIKVGPEERAHGPQMLPDGRTVLFTLGNSMAPDRWDRAQLAVQSLPDGPRRVLYEGGSDYRYLPTGHLLYAVSGTMFAMPFDAKTLVTGAQVPVIPGVRRAAANLTGSAHVAVSDTGTLLYRPGPAGVSSVARNLVIGDNRTDAALMKVQPAAYVHPRVSSDGAMLALEKNDGATASDIWIYDLSEKTAIQRLTLGGNNRFPVWSGSGRRVTFQSGREGDLAIFWQSVDGGGAERLTRPAQGEEHVPESWSKDGMRLLFTVVKATGRSLWVLKMPDHTIEPFGKVQSSESFSASFSTDGNWVVYAKSSIAGGIASPDRGVYVESYPSIGRPYQAPKTAIDYHPVWAPDGKSLYYIPSSARITVKVPVTLGSSPAFGTPIEMPRMPRPELLSTDVRGYDVLPDGRIIGLVPVLGETTSSTSSEIRVVLNWFDELKRLVPSK